MFMYIHEWPVYVGHKRTARHGMSEFVDSSAFRDDASAKAKGKEVWLSIHNYHMVAHDRL